MSVFTKSLAIECWTLYSIGLLLIAARFIARRIHLKSFKNFQADDYVMMFTAITYLGAILSVLQVGNNGSNYITEAQALAITPAETKSAIWGSKMSVVLEEFMVTTVWLVKACMLILYHRLTRGLWERRIVWAVAAYCVLGYVLVQVTFLGVWCRPFNGYWALPVQEEQCATYINHMIMVTSMNISSDCTLLGIYLPILISSKLPLKRKLLITGVFSLGVFVIIIAILNRILNFTLLTLSVYLKWNLAEVSTAIYVSNILLCWPLILRLTNKISKWKRRRTKDIASSSEHKRKRKNSSQLPLFNEKKAGDKVHDSGVMNDPMWRAEDTFMEGVIVPVFKNGVRENEGQTEISKTMKNIEVGSSSVVAKKIEESPEADTSSISMHMGVETVAMAGDDEERRNGLRRNESTITKSVHIETKFSD